MFKHLAVVCFALSLVVLNGSPLESQDFRLAPVPPNGHFVPPWFEGWYQNADGTRTYSFGYFNRNRSETLEVPIGPDNYIEPAEFNGLQPTSFPPGRHNGVFAVKVPADYHGDVVWHLRTKGRDNKVPGRDTSPAYEMGYQPMALGSVPPTMRFDRNGASGRGPLGIVGPPQSTRVGTPLQLTVWTVDESVREREAATGISWYKHQGPGQVTFTDASEEADGEGRATAVATFDTPGEYILRVRADNFESADSTPADQCCWTNGFVSVSVTR